MAAYVWEEGPVILLNSTHEIVRRKKTGGVVKSPIPVSRFQARMSRTPVERGEQHMKLYPYCDLFLATETFYKKNGCAHISQATVTFVLATCW